MYVITKTNVDTRTLRLDLLLSALIGIFLFLLSTRGLELEHRILSGKSKVY